MNQPLGSVLNNVEIVIRDLAPLGERTEQSRAALAVALENVDRIRSIVRDLLALSRVDDVGIGIGSVDVSWRMRSRRCLRARVPRTSCPSSSGLRRAAVRWWRCPTKGVAWRGARARGTHLRPVLHDEAER